MEIPVASATTATLVGLLHVTVSCGDGGPCTRQSTAEGNGTIRTNMSTTTMFGSVSEDVVETGWGVVGGSSNGCVRFSNINIHDNDKRQTENEETTGAGTNDKFACMEKACSQTGDTANH